MILNANAQIKKEVKEEKIVKPAILLPANCNIINLADTLKQDVGETISDFKKAVGYEIKDELEFLSKDDIELYMLEKDIPFEFKEHKPVIKPRPVIVTIMGHVDHGKTTLLDTLRNSKVADGEFGKITQSIGAFSIKSPTGEPITVIDTPGHEAFSKMRERGAKVTDCIILVVSCIEGAQKQTYEVIKLAQTYNIPLIIALNKIDRIDDEKNAPVLQELKDYGLKLSHFGGNIPVIFL